MKNDSLNNMHFERVGGSWQIAVRTADDLAFVRNLDAALWAVTSLPVDSISCDPEFLAFLDEDGNGRIRVDEARRAVAWLLDSLRDYSGINEQSDILKFDSINDATPEGELLLRSAKLAMENAGGETPSAISLAEIRDRKKIMAAGLQNGDGVIPPSLIDDPALAEFASAAMSCIGKVTDVSGLDGINQDILTKFTEMVSAYLKWHDEPLQNPAILPYGEATGKLAALCGELTPKIDDYFKFCSILKLSSGNTTKALPPLDVMNAAVMEEYLKGAPVCEPTVDSVLSLKADLNPLWSEKLLDFFAGTLPGKEEITPADWNGVKAAIAVYTAWTGRKTTDCLDSFPADKIRSFLSGGFADKITAMIAYDAERKDEILCFKDVRKLILYQKHMIEFMNNYVSLKALFNQEVTSMLLAGKLIMDGRHFTLTTKVTNLAAHKKLAVNSNICTMYVEIVTGTDTIRKMTLAAAVTSGDMYNLFIGKSGVFVTPDGTVWDATVIDYIQQPVSFSEALKMPFIRFGTFIGGQIDKFFSARTKEFESGFEKSVAKAQSYDPKNPPPAAKQQTPAVSGTMLLMGGGVGLAAIGSSVAFMAQALHKISIWNVIIILLCIMLIFGGPVVVISLIKLYRRNVASFLESGGWALNKRMRLSRKMGLIFTNRPKIPAKTLLSPIDVVGGFQRNEEDSSEPKEMSGCAKVFFMLLAMLIGLAVGAAIGFYIFARINGCAGC